MLSHDNEHNTSYFPTLKSYLDNNFNLTDTAQDLYIHRTTLLYRLKKMEELFKLRLDDPLRRLYYHLSVQIVAYASAKDTLLNE
ncbi:MAG: helix-turn-helix domain-containing protein [Oscillospiraceae bacterium]|nr:helix-turn-helix domain-containing protein [Oscillospiraceae bacterium]